jgi:hypothetical protein
MRWYSSSHADPKAIFRNLAKSASVDLPHPSQILAGIEEAALRI